MEKLIEGLNSAIETPATVKMGVYPELREVAKKWSNFVIEYNNGEALKRGLAISEAICHYINYLADGE